MSLRGWRILLICWMAMIFLISSHLLANTASFDSTGLLFGSINYVARKMAHVAEYAILAYLWFRSLWSRREGFRRAVFWSLVLSVLYAVTDEFHQSMVPERLGVWTDVLFDAAGALLACALLVYSRYHAAGGLRLILLGPLGDTVPTEGETA